MKRSVLGIVLVIGLVFSLPVFAYSSTPKKVAYVINGSLGDHAFYDSGYRGLMQIKKDFGVRVRVLECKFDPSLYYPSLLTAARWADVIFVISYGFEKELKQIADRFPSKIFVNVDTDVMDPKHLLSSIVYRQEEGAFLAGVTAAITTTLTKLPGINPQKIIGAVGGDDDIVIRAFMYGYKRGAHYIDPETQVKIVYIGNWDDPAKGKAAALQLYSEGADVVFQVAALAGIGVLKAAKQVGKYAIGVDSNENGIAPGHVITSDLKEVGKSIYKVYKMIVDGTYKKGKIYSFGVKEGIIGLAIDKYTRQILPKDVVDRIVKIQKEIATGKLIIPPYKPEKK